MNLATCSSSCSPRSKSWNSVATCFLSLLDLRNWGFSALRCSAYFRKQITSADMCHAKREIFSAGIQASSVFFNQVINGFLHPFFKKKRKTGTSCFFPPLVSIRVNHLLNSFCNGDGVSKMSWFIEFVLETACTNSNSIIQWWKNC